jgi:hypothetical protein
MGNQVFIISEKEFLKKEKEDEVGYTLLDKPKTIVATIKVIDLPLENQMLLNEHENMMTTELSIELLSIKNIDQHLF